uniref:Uncharacterized protein n=1 Tax=Macrostomum lignano TaxID=282301 RepID=A0A1I8FI92_9PLAT
MDWCRWCTNCWNSSAEAPVTRSFQSRLLTEAIRLVTWPRPRALIRGPGRRGGGCCQLGRPA